MKARQEITPIQGSEYTITNLKKKKQSKNRNNCKKAIEERVNVN